MLLLFILFFLNFTILKAEVIFILPEDVKMQNVNENMTKKIMNRDSSVQKQIENQYKGKLKYKPTNNSISNYRKGRFYSSVYFTTTKMYTSNINNYRITNEKFKDSIAGVTGVYFRNNFSIEFEYFDFINNVSSGDEIFEYLLNSELNNNIELKMKNYFLNFTLENNYSRIIPFFGIGIGAVNIGTKSVFQVDDTYGVGSIRFKGNIIAVYQAFIGFEFAVTSNSIISVRYKIYNLMKENYLRAYSDIENRFQDYKIEFKENSIINIGFKYLW
jgi:hypothetical protein